MAGFSQGGGVGLALSNWMVNGDPGFDVWGMDVARWGEWASLRYTNAKVRENYSRRFSIRFPNEELPGARPAQTTPLYDTMVANNAVMGELTGAWKRRCGLRRKPPSRRTPSPSTAPMISSISVTRYARRANASALLKSQISQSMKSRAREPRTS